MRKLLSHLPPYSVTLVVTALILYFTLVPSPLPEDVPTLFPHADKLIHAVMFWVFYTSLAFDRARRQPRSEFSWRLDHKWPSIIMITTLAFGAAVEVGQWAIGVGRTADILDFAADAAGAVVAALTYKTINRFLLR